MSAPIFLQNKKYLSAKSAAASVGYTGDYIGKLCRDGEVTCRRFGRSWYVEEESLRAFAVGQQHKREVRKQELAADRRSEYRGDVPVVKKPSAALASPMFTDSESVYRYTKPTNIAHPVTATLFRKMLAEKAQGARLGHGMPTPQRIDATQTLGSRAAALFMSMALVLGTVAFIDAAHFQTPQRIAQVTHDAVVRTIDSAPQTLAQAQAAFDSAVSALDTRSFMVFLEPQTASDFAVTQASRLSETVRNMFSYFTQERLPELTLVVTGGARGQVDVSVRSLPSDYRFAEATPEGEVRTPREASSATTQTASVRPITQTIVTNPVIERVIETERVVIESGITIAALEQTENELRQEIVRLSAANTQDISNNFRSIARTQRIDNLSDVDITNSRITDSFIDATGLAVAGTAAFDADVSIAGNLTIGGTGSLGSGLTSTNLTYTGAFTTPLSAGVAHVNGSGVLTTATGTADTIARFDASGVALVDSIITDDGSTVTVSGGLTVAGTSTLATTTIADATIGTGAVSNLSATNATTTHLVVTDTATLSGTTTLATTTINGDFAVNGNTTLGGASTDTVTITGFFQSGLIPRQNATYDLGTPALYWDDAYIDTLNVNSIAAASTSIGGTINESFTINTDNSTTDAEDMSLVFFRGTVVPNAVIGWDSARERFDLNQPIFVQNDSNTTTVPTLQLVGTSGQTAPLLRIDDYLNTRLLTLDSSGNLGIGTGTPESTLTVAGDARITGVLRDSVGGAGTDGFVLQTTGSGTQWVATSSLGFPAGHDAVTLSGSRDYLTLVGQDIVRGIIDVSDDTNLAVTATGLELSGDAVALSSGYTIPLLASTTQWATFYDTPSTQITAGTNISWVGNTLSVDDSFLRNDADDTTTGIITAGGFTTLGTTTLATTTATALSATTGTFSGALSALSATIANTVQAALGSFTNLTVSDTATTTNLVATNEATLATTTLSGTQTGAGTEDVLVRDSASGIIKRLSISSVGRTSFADLDDTTISTPSAGQLTIYDGTDSWDNQTLAGDVTLSSTGTTTITADAVALGTDTTGNYLATLVDAGAGFFAIGGSGSESAAATIGLTAGYTIPLLASTTQWDTAWGWGDHSTQNYFDLDSAPLTVLNGGTGTTTLATGEILLGNGTGSIQSTSTLSASLIQDAFLRNDADDTTTGVLTAGGLTTGGNLTVSGTTTVATTTVSGTLRAQGPIEQNTLGIDRIDLGVQDGTPRVVFEDAGFTNWLIDNAAGVFRWYTPGVERLTLDASGNLDLRTGGLEVGGTSVLTSTRALESLTGITSSGTITLSDLTGGFLRTNASGVLATSTINLASDVVGILPDANVSDTLTLATSSTVADGALSSNVSLLGQSIEGTEITDRTITADDLATSSVTATEIADGTITTTDISASAGITDAQVNNNLTIDGGTINNTPIGASVASTAVFTNATTTGGFTVQGALSALSATITNTIPQPSAHSPISRSATPQPPPIW